MAIKIWHIGRTPGQRQFDLAQFVEHYKTDSDAATAAIDPGVPQQGAAHPSFPFMFVTDRSFQETPNHGATYDITYMGCMTVDGGGNPILPPARNETSRSVQSATTYTSSAIFPAVASVPASVQFYGETTTIIEWSRTNTSTVNPPDPDLVVVGDLITWTLQATQPASSIPLIAAWILANGFVQSITATFDAREVVSGQYWQITKKKVRTLLPWAPAS